jgi:hypothetical protein
VHRRLANAVQRNWPITLSFLCNVDDRKDIFAVESTYIQKYDFDDWPQYRLGETRKRIDLVLVDKSRKHLVVVESKLPKPNVGHSDKPECKCSICQLNTYECLLAEDLSAEPEWKECIIHKILILYMNAEARRWYKKHLEILNQCNIALKELPPMQ